MHPVLYWVALEEPVISKGCHGELTGISIEVHPMLMWRLRSQCLDCPAPGRGSMSPMDGFLKEGQSLWSSPWRNSASFYTAEIARVIFNAEYWAQNPFEKVLNFYRLLWYILLCCWSLMKDRFKINKIINKQTNKYKWMNDNNSLSAVFNFRLNVNYLFICL